ncbi:MAG: acyl-CoA synthetase [Actinobacteria bacterium]|nr:acyl-CoA synthetase [Actinomycetota bacterium]
MPARTFNIADLFEASVDEWPDREYLIDENSRRTYVEMDRRANRLAHHLLAEGVKPGDHVGIYALNRIEWVEALWAIFKIRAVWININYRYVEDELAYLFGNADLSYLIVEPEFAERARAVQPDLRQLVIGPEFESALAAQSDERDFGPRSNDDIYMLFTGGTTGMPKGVVWRHEDVVMALGGGVDITTGVRMTEPTQFVEKGRNGFHLCGLPIAPLMHGATQWSVMGQSFVGNKVVLRAKFDPADVFRAIDAEKVNLLMITGDAMARPMLDHLVENRATYDLTSLFAVSSSAVLFSQACKDQFMEMFPNIVLTDAVGSSEGGANGITMVGKDAPKTPGLTVKAAPDSVVLGDDLRPVPAGVMGKLARTGNIPLRYHKDPEKSAATFVTGPDGTRYSIPGDFAVMQDDGSITLIGRGSVCINSGGEKIFPEEVENALKSHPEVFDAVVVGVPDERWGERVAAVVQARVGTTPSLESIQEHCRKHVAGYKVPRQLTLVDVMVRSPAGKSDYRWAKERAVEDAGRRA